jgi:hypothetical protein
MQHLRTAWQVICFLIVLGLVAVSVDGSPLLPFVR